MKTGKMITVIVMGLTLAAGLSAANAAILTFKFMGTIDTVNDPENVMDIELGDPFTFTYTFDASTPDIDPLVGKGLYAAQSMVFDVGNPIHTTCTLNGVYINVWNNLAGPPVHDVYKADGDYIQPATGYGDEEAFVEIVLIDNDANAYPSDAMPLTFDLDDYEEKYVELGLWHGPPTLEIKVTITSFTPEPGTISLLALGGLSMLKRRRR